MYSISIVTPTFNSMRTLDDYMQAILSQSYPHDKLEIIFADGGSTDGTLEKIASYASSCGIPVSVCPNPLRTGEAGKAVGVKKARNDIICLLDSDNIMPDEGWLLRMMRPFDEEAVIASEPIEYTWRREDSVINRYCALIGMNDPLCMFTGNYDRRCLVTGRWTEVRREERDCGDYLSVKFDPKMIPTIGANGFCIRTAALMSHFSGEYLFDIDVLWEIMQQSPDVRIAKVKTGIVHLFCPDVRTFCRKQNRRITDFLFFSEAKGRTYPWSKISKGRIILFALCCVTIIPLAVQAFAGWCRKHDGAAWAFHVPACWITLWVYGLGTIRGLFVRKQADRTGWKQ